MDPAPLQRMFQAARAEGITALAAFVGLCAVYSGKARRALQAGLEPPQPRLPAGPLLMTVREAATALGPSFTARKLYRLRPTMPPDCYTWKGGRLYFVLPMLRQWAARQ